MAIVFVPLNGIGLGHLSRAFAIASRLRREGLAPVMFSQGAYPDALAREVPGVSVGSIYQAAPAARLAIRDELQTYARRTSPAVVVEDTHPAPIELDPDIARLLIVRPATLAYLRELRARYAGAYRAFLVADHPESPLWPYTADETAELGGWPGWTCIGPVFRRGSAGGRARVRRRYGLRDGAPAYVFSMGGGGVQAAGAEDPARFCERAAELAARIRRREPESRLIFIRGPLLPPEVRVPAPLEEHPIEDDMPSLLGLAAGAVIRPGYNTTWECLAGGTPFLPIAGHGFAEPIAARLSRLSAAGLAPRTDDDWLDPAWRGEFRRRCEALRARWRPAAAVARVRPFLPAPAPPPPPSPPGRGHPPPSRRAAREVRAPIVVRVDDVTEVNDELVTLLALCRARGLALSLDVIPYLCRIDERGLVELAGDDLRIEIAQHGYAHLPRRGAPGRKAEFATALGAGPALRRGHRLLRRGFPTLFRGGFSPPYDFLPPGLAEAWFELGGRYLSVIWAELARPPGPVVRVASDPWDWRRGAPRPDDEILGELERAAGAHGHGGLALHPQLLRIPGVTPRLERLLDRVLDAGFAPALISELAGRASAEDRRDGLA